MRYIMSGDITLEKIKKIVDNWRTSKEQFSHYKMNYNYYNGNQKILRKRYIDKTKPCNKIVTNYCSQIVNQYLGYNLGNPVKYEVDERVQDFLNYNDVTEKDSLLLKNALVYGKAFELQYIDSDKINRFEEITALNGIDIYDDEMEHDELKAFIYFFESDNYDLRAKKYCDVYTRDEIIHYSMTSDFIIFEEIGREPHYFGQVPIIVMTLSQQDDSIFEQIIPLQDAYNSLLSANIDDYQAFVDAYLVLSNISATEGQVDSMKEKRVILLPNENSKAEFLAKPLNNTQVIEMLDNIRKRIYELSNTPEYSESNIGVASGIGLQWRMNGFSNRSKVILNNMEKALRKRIELFNFIEGIKGAENFGSVNITFVPNMPNDIADTADMIDKLSNIVSHETLISQLPFIKDSSKELENKRKEVENNGQNQQEESNISN